MDATSAGPTTTEPSPPSKLVLVLPIPPSVNHLYRNFTTKEGRRMRVPTPLAKKWFEYAEWTIKSEVNRTGWKPLDEKTVLDIWVWWPDHRDRDCDNLSKALLDVMKKEQRVVTDDNLCLPRYQDYDYDKHNPRVEVHVWKKDGSPPTGDTSTNETVPS